MRYGSLPIVREVGGLKDTVSPYDNFTGEGNGFTFKNYDAHEMLKTIDQALYFYKEKSIWNKMMKTAMREDFSWKNSAAEYLKLYDKLINSETAEPADVYQDDTSIHYNLTNSETTVGNLTDKGWKVNQLVIFK
jgi:glycogen synthase